MFLMGNFIFIIFNSGKTLVFYLQRLETIPFLAYGGADSFLHIYSACDKILSLCQKNTKMREYL